MSRLVNILFALVLLAALVIALDPQARRKALDAVRDLQPTIQQLDDQIVLDVPSVEDPEEDPELDVTPVPSPTPFATPVVDDDVQIPVTGDEDSSDEPIIQVNWDALGDSLRKFWVSLQNVKINWSSENSK